MADASVFSPSDRAYMVEALALAERGLYTTAPNPRVGALIVRGGVVVGHGFHERAGGPHAEIAALAEAGDRARGATVYVTLEPCGHHGRTPPCVDALAAAGVARVVAAMADPNPLARHGADRLRAAGIAVDIGLMETESRELNVGFVSRLVRGRPWVRLKVAATLDGRTALAGGESQWITGAEARRDGHRWRARACAILTGIGTVKDDDPQLTVREVETTRQPLKILVDSKLEVSPGAKLFESGRVLVATAIDDREKNARLADRGAEVLVMPNTAGKVDLTALMEELAKRELNEIHVEAGAKLNGSLVAGGVVDELLVYLAPSLIGDSGRGMFNLPAPVSLDARRRLALRDVTRIGEDVRVVARLGS